MGKLLSWAALGAVNVVAGGVWRLVLMVLRAHEIEKSDAPKGREKAVAVQPATITLTSSAGNATPVTDGLLRQ